MSGSALVNSSGELIGVNAAILSPTGSFSGYSFAIPSGLVRKLLLDLLAFGCVRHTSLDILFRDMDAEQAARLKMKNVNGVLVNSLTRGEAGDMTGIRRDDMLLMFDQLELGNAAQCREILAERASGDTVTLVIWRDSGMISLMAKLSVAGEDWNVANSKGDIWPLQRTAH